MLSKLPTCGRTVELNSREHVTEVLHRGQQAYQKRRAFSKSQAANGKASHLIDQLL